MRLRKEDALRAIQELNGMKLEGQSLVIYKARERKHAIETKVGHSKDEAEMESDVWCLERDREQSN